MPITCNRGQRWVGHVTKLALLLCFLSAPVFCKLPSLFCFRTNGCYARLKKLRPVESSPVLFFSSNRDSERDENNDPQRQPTIFPAPRRQFSPPITDTDFKPKRIFSPEERRKATIGVFHNEHSLKDWGIEKLAAPKPTFPDTIDAVANAAYDAITGALYDAQRLDPNLASNAMAQNTIYDYRPVRSPQDAGRIGIEIDGANFLRTSEDEFLYTSRRSSSSNSRDVNGNGIRRVVLQLAQKLSQSPWKPYEDHQSDVNSTRPVVIYFNTVKQALVASRQIQLLKQAELEKSGSNELKRTSFDEITILCLGQDDDLPENMKNDGKRKRKRKEPTGIDPTKGLVIVVQPTDFNEEYRPPGPAIGVLDAFQKLVVRASMQELPVIMVSPRFLVKHSLFAAGSGRGWDQSGGSTQSATYGGMEPPNGPTPWILRDFNPPVYCWIGNALTFGARERYQLKQHKTDTEYCRVALTQSAMDEGHSWHHFVLKRTTGTSFSYEYLASTKSSSGRPTRDIMKHILSDFDAEEKINR